jgi:hypothetical protein
MSKKNKKGRLPPGPDPNEYEERPGVGEDSSQIEAPGAMRFESETKSRVGMDQSSSPENPDQVLDESLDGDLYDSEKREEELKPPGASEVASSNTAVYDIFGKEAQQPQQESSSSQNVILGPSPYIASDKWTRDDSLGYGDYAHAIARFLTHDKTKSPLSISIQAPWGGGKTSLMRMVQKELDAEADQSYVEGVPLVETQFRRTVNDILKVLKNLQTRGGKTKPYTINDIQKDADKVKPRITIWFNAWKYESTEQVWAGLADSIVKQTVRRLKQEEREEFLFELHLRRQNIDRIRTKIYDQILKSWWHKTRPWIWASLTGLAISISIAIVGSDLIASQLDSVLKTSFGWSGLGGLIGSILIGAIPSFANYLGIRNEPAEMVAGEFVDMPNYTTNLGFIHQVEEDLRRIFDTVPKEKYLPMIVFIDDLDRCSPEKIADVVEGINLFLAGEFEDCMFVLGIDAEMVAAALEVAHSKVIEKLPRYSTRTPVGRRFMDKFVQLPVVVPIPERESIQSYVESLLASQESHYNRGAISENTARVARIKSLDDKIDNYSDNDPKIRKLISEATSSFSNNPREMKRFMNVFRFQYFLLLARKNRGLPVPTDDQLKRWIILSLKWPEVVRWLQWRALGQVNNKDDGNNKNTEHEGLKILERTLGSDITNAAESKESVASALGIEQDKSAWFADEGLRKFFRDEVNERDPKKRLSASIENGFY